MEMLWRSALLGMVPQWVQPPPTLSCFSTMAIFWPDLASAFAAGTAADNQGVVVLLRHIIRSSARRLGCRQVSTVVSALTRPRIDYLIF
jgi:hypothetical protein